MTAKPRIVVLGGGFAGLNLVKKLDKKKFDISLVDRHNYHTFPPLFYQVASSELDPTSICFPFRREFQKRKSRSVRFHVGEVRSVDLEHRCVTTDYETIPYDKLILALGTTNNFFGNPQLIDEVYTLKSTDEAIRIRNEILFRCERAAIEPDREKRRRMLSFVVIGGGPAGVEIAGAIGELKRYILKRDYPEIPVDDLNITIIEGTDRLLGTMSPEASATALRDLGQLMVSVRLGRLMKTYENNEVTLDDGSKLYSEMVIWTAGVTGVPVAFTGKTNPDGTPFSAGRGGRYATDEYCRIKGLDDVYAIGDINLLPTEKYPKACLSSHRLPSSRGVFSPGNLNEDRWDKPFSYVDKGSMATIGRNRAVADLHKIHLSGFGAWLAWMFIHLISLLGMRSKTSVLFSWVWAYFSYNTALRLLLFGSKYPKRGSMWDKG